MIFVFCVVPNNRKRTPSSTYELFCYINCVCRMNVESISLSSWICQPCLTPDSVKNSFELIESPAAAQRRNHQKSINTRQLVDSDKFKGRQDSNASSYVYVRHWNSLISVHQLKRQMCNGSPIARTAKNYI